MANKGSIQRSNSDLVKWPGKSDDMRDDGQGLGTRRGLGVCAVRGDRHDVLGFEATVIRVKEKMPLV